MKRYSMSFGAAIDHVPAHPERTARATAPDGWDIVFQVWPNRAALARSVRMQEKREPRNTDWRPVVKLGLSEGY